MTIEIKTTAGEIFEGNSVSEALREIVKYCEGISDFVVKIESINNGFDLSYFIPLKQSELDYALDKAREENEKHILENDSQTLLNDYKEAII